MPGSVKTALNPFISQTLGQAASTLKSRKTLKDLIGTASFKIDSRGDRIKHLRDDLRALLRMLKAWASGEYREAPWRSLLLCTGAVIYFVNPFDAVPDFLPATGLLDDAAVTGFVLASVKKDIEKFREPRSRGKHTYEPSSV